MTWRRTETALLALTFLLVVGTTVVVRTQFNEDAVRLRAQDAVRRATGRELTIQGPVRLAWSLTPTIAMEDVSLANPPGLSRPAMAHVARAEARLALWPLLSSRRVEVLGLTLVQPDVLLERDAQGRPNWVFTKPAAAPSTPQAPAAARSPRPMFIVDDVQVSDGRIGLRTADRVDVVQVATLSANASGPDAPVQVAGTLDVNGSPVLLQGTTGAWATGGDPWPVALTLSSAGAVLKADGAVGGSLGVTAAVPDLADLSALAGRPLPHLRDILAAAQLGAAGLSAPVPVKLKMTAARAMVTGDGTADLRGGGLDLAVSAQVPDLRELGAFLDVRLPALHDLAGTARVVRASNSATVALRGLRLTAPGSDIAGDLALTLSPRLALRGSLVSQQLDLDALLVRSAEEPAAAPSPAPAPSGPAAAPPPAGWLLPKAPLPFEALRRADGDLQVAVSQLTWRGTAARAVQARLLLQKGRLQLDPFMAQLPGGPVLAQVTADANGPVAAVNLRATELAVGPMLAALGAPDGAAGTLDLDVALRGRGASLHDLAGALNGHAGLALVDGKLDNRWLLDVLGDALRGASLPFEPGGRSTVRCLALRADAAGGTATFNDLLLDTTRMHLDGDGTASLGDETLDLHLRALVRVGGSSLALPLHLSGPFRKPKAQAEIKGDIGRSGLIIGGAPPPDDCGSRLTQARDGRVGQMPAALPEPPRAKPADLFRNLFR
jgi:uncharacterized protein involved in outer membrane biogenesis